MPETTIKRPLFLRVNDVSEEIVTAVIDLKASSVNTWIERMQRAIDLQGYKGFHALEFSDYEPNFLKGTGDEGLDEKIWEEEVVVLDVPFVFSGELIRLAYCLQHVDATNIYWDAAEKHSVTSIETAMLNMDHLKGWL